MGKNMCSRFLSLLQAEQCHVFFFGFPFFSFSTVSILYVCLLFTCSVSLVGHRSNFVMFEDSLPSII